MKKVRITVLKKEYYPELAKTYLTDGGAAGPCALLNVGDSLLFEGNAQMPSGFCPWARKTLHKNGAGRKNRPATIFQAAEKRR